MKPSLRSQIGLYALGAMIIAWSLVPVIWIISLSFKVGDDINNQNFWPTKWKWDNYDTVFSTSLFTSALRNSLGIVSIATLISLLFATFAAYAITRLDFPEARPRSTSRWR